MNSYSAFSSLLTIPMVRMKDMLRPSQAMKGGGMAANLSNRIAALEKQVTQIAENFHLVCCQGCEPTAKERAEAARYEHVIFVVWGKKEDGNHGDTANPQCFTGT